jgi:hexosaminidase
MPLPTTALPASGNLPLDGGLQVVLEGHTEPRLERARDRFLQRLAAETGILYPPPASATQPKLVIQTTGPSKAVEELGEDESYHLAVTPAGATLSAPNPLGILHGLQTFLQLVEPTPQGFAVGAVTIDDQPRFAWRGLMIDSARHFIPLSEIRQNLDMMEAVKLNVLHWHLSDDQGFRVESKIFPLLQGKGSDGLYYTQDEIKATIDYARDRGVRIVPEFDIPAHSASWFLGYPELASGTGPYHLDRLSEDRTQDPAMDPTKESTYKFLDRFFGEMTALFPDAYFHMGGDECDGKEWDANSKIQEFKRQHSLKDNAALQAYFTDRVQKLITKHGKITIGWDEVLQPETPKNVVIHSWRGQASLAQAARGGNRGILSWGYYLDLNEPASQHYGVDPLEGATADLTPEQQKLILGGEAAEWTEYITPENINFRIWPRTAAIAERLWSPQATKDVASMYRRMALLSARLGQYGYLYQAESQRMVRRLTGGTDVASLDVLASVVEAPKEYDREGISPRSLYLPLNKLIDSIPAESDTAREFRAIAARIAAGKGTPEDFDTARAWLTLWRDNDAELAPELPQSSLTAELAPLSRNLSLTAAIGLAALNAIEKQQPVDAAAQQGQLAALKGYAAPQAVLLDMVVPGVAALVAATPH